MFIKKILFLLIGIPLYSSANIQVSPLNVYVSNNNDRFLTVRSMSDQFQYVLLDSKIIVNPATENEKEEKYSYSDKDCALVFTPRKLVLPPGSTRKIKLLSTCVPNSEKVYRLNVSGVNDDTRKKTQLNNNEENTIKMSLSLSWGVLVHVLPNKTEVSFDIDESKLFNTGNISVRVNDITYFDRKGACEKEILDRKIYPEGGYIRLSKEKNCLTKIVAAEINYKTRSNKSKKAKVTL